MGATIAVTLGTLLAVKIGWEAMSLYLGGRDDADDVPLPDADTLL